MCKASFDRIGYRTKCFFIKKTTAKYFLLTSLLVIIAAMFNKQKINIVYLLNA